MSGQRRVQFELHIRPMFRRKDRDNMIWAFDMWDYDDVRTNADRILIRLLADMPPESHGGTWPVEWIDLFQRWIDEGFPRLEPGQGTYTATQNGNVVKVGVTGTWVEDGYRGWLQRTETNQSMTDLEFDLYFEPPAIPTGVPGQGFNIEERMRVPGTVETVTINDVTGPNVITLP